MTTLLRCVKTAEDTSGRGEAASEAAIEAIGQEIAALHMDNEQQTRREATPEDLVAATKAVTEAVAGGVKSLHRITTRVKTSQGLRNCPMGQRRALLYVEIVPIVCTSLHCPHCLHSLYCLN